MKIKSIFIIITLILLCCKKKFKSEPQNTYLADINFEVGFNEDRVKIYSRDKLLFESIISTDNQIALAKSVNLSFPNNKLKIIIENDTVYEIMNNNYMFFTVNKTTSGKLSISRYNKKPSNLFYD